MSELCAKCGRAPEVGCDGRGYIRDASRADDLTVEACPNIYRRQLAQHLGPEIANTVHTSDTPLLKLNPVGGEPLVDLTKKNLFITCPWRGLLPHLKYTLAFKGVSFYTRIVTDERIRSVFLGDESYRSRSAKIRDDLDTYNKLADLLGSDFDLVIVKLGYLGYKNVAAPGALKEALLHRESINKATWLVLDPEHAWMHSHNEDVGTYVDEHFPCLAITPAEGAPPALGTTPDLGIAESEEDPPSLDSFATEDPSQAREKPPRVPEPKPESKPVDVEDNLTPWENQPPRRKPWGRR